MLHNNRQNNFGPQVESQQAGQYERAGQNERAGKYSGILCIGDPHLASRVPGFRQDDYPRVVLRKLSWCLDYARQHSLLPCILGDFFHWPRDNANWLIRCVLEMLDQPVLAIPGNHDCAENRLSEDDSLGILEAAGKLQLVDRSGPWQGIIGDHSVVIGGTAWGDPIPEFFQRPASRRSSVPVKTPPDLLPPLPPNHPTANEASPPGELQNAQDNTSPLVLWLTHCDIVFPGYEEAGWFKPQEIPGIDVVINGHIHRSLPDVVTGNTTWINPGNIARIKRSDSTRERVPCVLRMDMEGGTWNRRLVGVPHTPFEDAFHAEVTSQSLVAPASAFVSGLAELIARRTETGAGLREFLSQNLSRFDPRVARQIELLAQEVLQDGIEQKAVSVE